ncbi:hypothetical protein GCM10009108_04150 [Castellaniella ginsengisoli]|uniref:Uncharacterized protein n=1 Tax=Castellaniella ginsengisoli TaxID=546114 RepID=A0ABN1KQT4_9BURK
MFNLDVQAAGAGGLEQAVRRPQWAALRPSDEPLVPQQHVVVHPEDRLENGAQLCAKQQLRDIIQSFGMRLIDHGWLAPHGIQVK